MSASPPYVSKMQYSLSAQGLSSIFKHYEVVGLQTLWTGKELSSFEVYKAVNTVLSMEGQSISRASVINFLNDLVDEEILDYREVTGKGGYRRIYQIKPKYGNKDLTQKALAERIIDHISKHLLLEE